MDVVMKPLADIRPYENNPRLNDKAVDAVAESITRFGFRQPIVTDEANVIICGHTRWKAATTLGLSEVPVHVACDLSDEQIRAYRIADNRTAELAEWDMDLLPVELGELQEAGVDWSLLGFGDQELQAMLDGDVKAGLTDPDAVPEPPDEPVTALGDVWNLGRHRLMCGDAASADDVQQLLDGQSVQLVNCDPPYGVAVEPRSGNAIAAGQSSFPAQSGAAGGGKMRARDRAIANDNVCDSDFEQLLQSWLQNLSGALDPGRAFYVWSGYSNFDKFLRAIAATGLKFSQAIVWHKQHPVINRHDFMGDFELGCYGWNPGAAHVYLGPNNATDVWQVKKVNPNAMVHLTEKPVELAVRAMQYSSRTGERVLDLFGGSGSTLIAAEQTGRRALLMEIDALYCDVIVRRWEEFTGLKAERKSAPVGAES